METIIKENDKNKADKLLNPDQVADMLSVSKTTIYRLIERRKIPFYKVGGCIRFSRVQVERYLDEHRVEPIN